MSVDSGVSINPECITAFNELRLGRGKTKFIIFKIADNRREIVVDEASQESDYEVFRTKLEEAKDAKGNPAPRYAVYDVEFELEGGEGKRNKIVFISWVPSETPTFWSMLYATTRQTLKNALSPQTSIHADDKSELEWKNVLSEASGHRAVK
jgi:cofilin